MAGTKKEEYREIKEGITANRYLLKDSKGKYVLNPEVTEAGKEYFIDDYNNGYFPFVPKSYKYLSLAVGYIAEGNIADIAQHFGTIYGYYVSIKPVIKCDIKDGKVRVTYTLPFYNVVRFLTVNKNARNNETWLLDSCFPFVKKDSHKKASSKALVMAHAYSNVVIDKIEECIKSGLTGNENENW